MLFRYSFNYLNGCYLVLLFIQCIESVSKSESSIVNYKEKIEPSRRHNIAHFCPNLDVARVCIRKCMKLGKPAFCGKDHICYCGHRYDFPTVDYPDPELVAMQFKDLYEKYFGLLHIQEKLEPKLTPKPNTVPKPKTTPKPKMTEQPNEITTLVVTEGPTTDTTTDTITEANTETPTTTDDMSESKPIVEASAPIAADQGDASEAPLPYNCAWRPLRWSRNYSCYQDSSRGHLFYPTMYGGENTTKFQTRGYSVKLSSEK